MFEIVRRLRGGLQSRQAAGKDRVGTDGSSVRLIAVTQDADGWRHLRDIADGFGWLLLWASSCEKAIQLIERDSISLALCDRDLPGEDWRIVVQRLASLSRPVCVLLASSVCDDYLWKEVAQHGGFDVLAKPFEAERVARAVKLAWSWRGWSRDRRAQLTDHEINHDKATKDSSR
jgi:DNA-binding NtrC family response regulator